MSDTEFLECNSYPDQLYSIDASDLNSEGIAEKKINGKCIGDIDIYNDAYNEVLLYFIEENVEIKGTIRLENKGKLKLNLGDYKLINTTSENIEELVITSTDSEDNTGLIKDVRLDSVLINKGVVKLKGNNVVGQLNIEETQLDLDEKSELVSNEVFIKSINRDFNLMGKITVQDSFIYNGKCITLDKESSIISKDGNIEISLLNCNLSHNGYIWSGKDLKLELEKGYLANKGIIGADGIGNILVKESGAKLINSGSIQGGVDFTVRLEANGKVENEKDGIINGKDNIKITAGSVNNQAGAKISSVNSIELDITKLINSGAIYYKKGKLNIRDGLINNGIIIGEELTNIKMGRNGEIHNNENARIKLDGNVYVGSNDDKSISLLRNYAANIGISGEELRLNIGKIENLAKEGSVNEAAYDCLVIDVEDKAAIYFLNTKIQSISYVKHSRINLGSINTVINGKIVNKNSLLEIGGKFDSNSRVSIENIGINLLIKEHKISIFSQMKTVDYEVYKTNENYLKKIGDDYQRRGRKLDFTLKFQCIKTTTEDFLDDIRNNVVDTKKSYARLKFKNPDIEITVKGDKALNYVDNNLNLDQNIRLYNIIETKKDNFIYKSYPSTVAFTDVEGARLAGLSNYAVAKSELSNLLDQFRNNNNALVPYDLKSQEIEKFKLSAIDMLNNLRKEGYEIRLDNVFNFGSQNSQEARFLRYFFEQYNPGIYKVNTPNQLAIGDGSCGDSCALAGDGTGLVASGGLVTNYIFESIFELPGMKQKGTAYLLKELGYSTGDIIQILADPDYEHEVLKRAIFDKLGKAYIWNHKKNDDDEFDQLLKNAVTAKRDLGLIPGIELTRWQQSELVDAILWPVKESINGIEAWSLRLYVTEEILKDGYSSATIALKNTTLMIDEDVFNGGLIDSIGDTFIEARNIYQLNQIKGSGSLNVETRGSFIMEMLVKVIEDYSSNSHKVSYVPINAPAVDLSGSFKVNSKGNIGVKGGEIKADTIAIESGDKVIVIPAAIYNYFYHSWSDGYSRNESLEYELARIMASGDIKIVSQNGNYLYSPVIKTEGEFELEAKLGKNVIEAVANKYISERYEDDSWFVFSSETYSYSSITNIIRPFISAAKKVVFGSLEDTAIRAAIIITSSMEIKTGKDDIVGLISLLPGKNIMLKEEWGESDYVIRSKKYVGKSVSEEIVPTIIQINNDCKGVEGEGDAVKTMDGKCATFIGYGSGGWLQLASKVEAETIEIKAPKGIKLVVAPELDFSYAAVDKKGIGFAFTSNSREQSVGLGIKVSKSRETNAEAIHRVSSLVGHFITLDTDEAIYTEGAYIKAEEKLTTRSKLEIHDVAIDTKTYSQRKVEGFLGFKLGIQNSIAGLIESGKSVDKSIRQGGKEGAINTAFAAWDAYNTLMGIAAGGGLFQGGVWLAASYQESSNELDKRTVKFTTIEVGKEEDGKLKEGTYESTSEELRLKSTQIKAYDAYFNTNKLTTNTANNEEHRRSQGGGINIQVGMSGTVGSNVGGNTGKLNSDEIVPIHAEIYVTNRLELKVKGHADIKGTFIEAKSLEASFESLILESVKELEESSGRSFGLSKGWGNSVSKNYGGSFEVSSGKRNVVSKLTRLVGQEYANIIVAHALELNGAMIANAEVDEEGNYKDVGNLILTVGELFVKHVYDSDEGYTLGASINYIAENKGSDGKISKYGVVIGGRDGDGYTFATIGKGEVKCTESRVNKVCEIEKANRDVSKTSSFDYDYKIETIRAKFSSLDEETKKKAIENLKSGKFFENIATSFMDAVNEVEKVINELLPKEKVKEIDEEFKNKREVNKDIKNNEADEYNENVDSDERNEDIENNDLDEKEETTIDEQQEQEKQESKQDDPSKDDNKKLNSKKEVKANDKKLRTLQKIEEKIDNLDISVNEKAEAKYLLRKSIEEINMMPEAEQNKLAEEIKNQGKFSILDILMPKAEAAIPAAIGACLSNPWCAGLLLSGTAVISNQLQDAVKSKSSYQEGISLFDKGAGGQFNLKKVITQIGFGAKTLILENGQSVIIDDDNYQQLKQSNQIVKENGLEYIINPSVIIDETGKEYVISTPIPKKTPDLPGYPINDNKKPNIEVTPEADKQEPLPGFIPVKIGDDLKGSTIHDQNFDDFTFSSKISESDKKTIQDALNSGDNSKVSDTLGKTIDLDIPKEALDKIPSDLNVKQISKNGEGIRFRDSDSGNQNVRIMKGNPTAKEDSQKNDYVKITSGGKIIGKDGRVIEENQDGFKNPSDHPNAHIPKKEWVKWKQWNKQ